MKEASENELLGILELHQKIKLFRTICLGKAIPRFLMPVQEWH